MSAWNYPQAQSQTWSGSRGKSAITALIISDDPIVRNALADAIATEGSGSIAIESVDDAVARLECTNYPLIFAPQQFPGLSGSDICSRLRSTVHGENAWIVALPRYDVLAIRQLMSSGFDGLLSAPFDPQEIALLISGAARNARAGEQLRSARERAEMLRSLAQEMSSASTSAELANYLIETVTAVLPNSAASVWLKDRDGSGVTCAGTFGLSSDYEGHAQQLFSYFTPDRWLGLARNPMYVNAMSDAPRSFTDVARLEGYAASLTLALMTPAGVNGALVVYMREQTAPVERDIDLIETFCASASLAFDRVEIQQQVDTLQTVIEHLPDGVFISDPQGHFLLVNPAMEQITGRGRGDLEALTVFDLLEGGASSEPAMSVRLIMQAMAEHEFEASQPGTGDTEPVVEMRRADGKVVHAELHLHQLRAEFHRSDVLIQGVFHDVSDRVRTRREFDALRATAAAMATAADLDQAIDGVVQTLREQTEYSDAAIWLLHPNGVELVIRQSGSSLPLTTPVGEGPVGRAAATGETVFFKGAHGALTVVGQPQDSRICVPIVSKGEVAGVIDVTGGSRKPLDDQDVTFLSSLATHLASSVERIRLHNELQRQAATDSLTGLENRETFLGRLDNVIQTAGHEPVSLLIVGVDRFKAINDTYGHLIADDMLKQVAETLRVRVRAPQTIARYTSDQFAMILPATDRLSAPAIAENFRIGVATQLFMAAEQVEQMTVSVGAATYPNDADSLDQLLLAASHAMYLAKQAGRNQVYQSNEAFAELAAAHGRITDLLRQSPKETLALLVRAMDQRTPERAGHSQRVADYAMALGRTLGMRDEELSALRIAAVIHDIGMFSLPDSLLRKPAGLSDSERELLYGIPINAHRLLSQLPLPESVLPAVVHQHEHWDGSGFPSGLKGDLIPPGARIIAVADAIDAMTSDRAHRQSLTMDEALTALVEQAGAKFDPDVVRASRALLGELQDVSQDRPGRDLESTLVEALAIIPPVERASA
jgi:diguanylate cyclase (GGDEF)-like protein/PAS domain S-box-containing protein